MSRLALLSDEAAGQQTSTLEADVARRRANWKRLVWPRCPHLGTMASAGQSWMTDATSTLVAESMEPTHHCQFLFHREVLQKRMAPLLVCTTLSICSFAGALVFRAVRKAWWWGFDQSPSQDFNGE